MIPVTLSAQHFRATITGGGGDGKCTFEVFVDGVADVEIHGDQADLHNISGNPANWRRLVCNQPLPNNPVGFRFQGVDGRGRQTLVRDPNSSGGVAVIRLEDPQPGGEGYTGDITWRGGDVHYGGVGNWSSGGQERPRDIPERQAPDRPDQGREFDHGRPWGQRIGPNDATNICRNQVVVVRNVPLLRVRAVVAGQEPDGDYRVNFNYTNPYGGQKAGSCTISASGQILNFQVEQRAPDARTTWNQALDLCQREAAKTFAVPEENVRVQHGVDPGNGSFLINYQAQDRSGRIRTGACRVSSIGEIEDFRRW